jgi:hypothetical protein
MTLGLIDLDLALALSLPRPHQHSRPTSLYSSLLVGQCHQIAAGQVINSGQEFHGTPLDLIVPYQALSTRRDTKPLPRVSKPKAGLPLDTR